MPGLDEEPLDGELDEDVFSIELEEVFPIVLELLELSLLSLLEVLLLELPSLQQ
jgi:hypothetical protein